MSRKRKKNREYGEGQHDEVHGAAEVADEGNDPSGQAPSGEPVAEVPDSPDATGFEHDSTSGEDTASGRLESELDRLGREAADMRNLALRTQAEFENYRKRMERDRAELARLAAFDVVKEVLPVLDNLERALRASESSPEEQLRAGIEIVHRQFKEILGRLGLSEVESEGKLFDPHLHEAVTRVETTKHPEGTVVEVFQKGYSFKDRLLRPAMVAVAQSPGDSGSPGGGMSPDDENQVVRRSE